MIYTLVAHYPTVVGSSVEIYAFEALEDFAAKALSMVTDAVGEHTQHADYRAPRMFALLNGIPIHRLPMLPQYDSVEYRRALIGVHAALIAAADAAWAVEGGGE